MKFIKLEILNLASLDKQGGEIINFEEGALGETSIFSIVGPTGSGKSTILDAICLPLYNRAPRYPHRKGERGDKITVFGGKDDTNIAPTDCRNILTRGKKNGYSKLTFLANNGNLYRAEWHVKFNTKKYDDPVNQLYLLTNKNGTIEETECKWDDLPTIIGLDYEQFLRTVLIAQGSFSEFLKAKDDERFILLEKIIGCEDTYVKIVEGIRAKKEESEAKLKEINAELEAYKNHLLSDEKLAADKEEIKVLEEQEKRITEQLKAIEEGLKWYADNDTLLKSLNDRKEEEKKAKEDLDSIKHAINRLNLHDAILPAIDIQREIDRLDKEIDTLTQETGKINRNIENKKKTIDEQEKIKAEQETKAKKIEAEIEEAKPHIIKARELRTQIETAKTILKEKTEIQKKAESEKLDADKALEKNKEKIKESKQQKEIADAELQSIKDKLESNNWLNVDVEELQKEKETASDNLSDLKSGIEIVESISNNSKQLAEWAERQKEITKDNLTLNGRLKSLNIDQLKTETDALQRTYTLMTSENWKLHREQLKDDEPCPLCGSTHHPYAQDQQKVETAVSAVSSLLNDKKLQLEQQLNEEKAITGKLKRNEGELQGLQISITKGEEDQKALEIKWKQLFDKHNTWEKEKISLTSLLPDYEKTKKNKEDALSEYNKLQKKKEQATRKVTDANLTLTENEALTSNLTSQQNEKTKALSIATEQLQDAEKKLQELQTLFNEELNGKDPDIEENRHIEAKKENDRVLDQTKDNIGQQKTELGNLQGALSAKEQQLQSNKTTYSLKSEALSGWIDTYNSNNGSPITTDVVKELLSEDTDWEAIRKNKEEKEHRLNSISALTKDAETKHTEHQQNQPAKTIEELNNEKVSKTDNSQQQRLIELKAELKNHEDALLQIGDKAGALTLAKQTYEEWKSIYESIGSDGKTLRKIAQCYTLRFLIEHANFEIRKFNSRYELSQVQNSLSLRVIDHDRADNIRDTTTLSGGETFIVSLGLALGLSALSSRNISFDNLFIDEGFGTLDPDALDSVIDSLTMLQTSQGKKVGVISHTETMSERISTQIRVIKNGNSGSSHIDIYPQ